MSARSIHINALAHRSLVAQGHGLDIEIDRMNGDTRRGRIVRRTTDDSLLPKEPRRRLESSNVLLHLDDDGPPIPLRAVTGMRRAPA